MPYIAPDQAGAWALPAHNTNFYTDTLTVTLRANDLKEARYETSEGASGTYIDGQKIVIGSKTKTGESINVTLTGTSTSGKTVSGVFTYNKKERGVTVYFDNVQYNWKAVYAYIYATDGTTTVKNAAWPGEAMTYNSEYKLYEISIPDELLNGRVIFTESKSATTNRYPADQKPGLAIGGKSMKFSYGNTWEAFVAPVEELKSTSVVSPQKIALGQSTKVSLSSTGGKGEVTYAVYYKKIQDTKWSCVQSFSKNTTLSITPSYATAYEVCVKVKDSTGTIVKTYSPLNVTANEKTDLVNISIIPTPAVVVDKPITVYCVSEGANNVTYAVYYKKSTDTTWTKKQDFSTNTQVNIKPASATPYNVCVKAKDSAGNIAKVYLEFTATASADSNLTNTSTISATSAKVGEKITVKASGTGNSGTKTYAFYYKAKSDTKWTAKKSFSSTTSVGMTFSKAGTYEICVKVKDATGSIAKKYFTVKIS